MAGKSDTEKGMISRHEVFSAEFMGQNSIVTDELVFDSNATCIEGRKPRMNADVR
jgi:hypothetical protein